jgi:type II secretion system protein H
MAATVTTQMWVTGMHADRGFTLLELLLVLSVLALLAALGASAGLTPGARRAAQQPAQLEALLVQARSTALAQGRSVQVIRQPDRVTTTAGTAALQLMPSTRLQWYPALAVPAQRDAIVFYADGSATPGVLELVGNGNSYRLQINWWGGIASAAIR